MDLKDLEVIRVLRVTIIRVELAQQVTQHQVDLDQQEILHQELKDLQDRQVRVETQDLRELKDLKV